MFIKLFTKFSKLLSMFQRSVLVKIKWYAIWRMERDVIKPPSWAALFFLYAVWLYWIAISPICGSELSVLLTIHYVINRIVDNTILLVSIVQNELCHHSSIKRIMAPYLNWEMDTEIYLVDLKKAIVFCSFMTHFSLP